jgi:regulatory protein
MDRVKKYVPPFEALDKMKRYCSIQERSYKAVREKLYNFGLKTDQVENILVDLITENYLNEQRFAAAYASGKFRIKGWGKRKIAQGMKQLNISDACISSAIEQLDEDEYEECLTNWVEKRAKLENGLTVFEARGRVARFLINKGFESEKVWEKVKELI